MSSEMKNFTVHELECSDRDPVLHLLQIGHPQTLPPDVNAGSKNCLYIHIMSSCLLISAIWTILGAASNKKKASALEIQLD